MDSYAQILASLLGLEARLREAGVDAWLREQPKVDVEGRTCILLGGDRLASEAEAMLAFAVERGLVHEDALREAASRQPLPEDVEGIEIETREGDE